VAWWCRCCWCCSRPTLSSQRIRLEEGGAPSAAVGVVCGTCRCRLTPAILPEGIAACGGACPGADIDCRCWRMDIGEVWDG